MGLFDFLKNKEFTEIKELKMQLEHYRAISNIENEIENQTKILGNLITSKKAEIKTMEDNFDKLNTDYKSALETYTTLSKEVSIFESKLDLIEFGVHEPIYDFGKSAEYRAELKKIIDLQRQMISSETAVICGSNGNANANKAKGLARTRRARTKRYIKLTLRAFNGECDSLISKVKSNNLDQIKERISKSFESINKIGKSQTVTINIDYLDLKIKELVLEYEYQQKRQREKEELREEESARRKFVQAQKEAEKEEIKFQKALEKARKDIESATGERHDKLLGQIAKLEQELREAQERKEEAISMAQQIKHNYVYVISSIGSHEEKVKNEEEQITFEEIIAEEFQTSLAN